MCGVGVVVGFKNFICRVCLHWRCRYNGASGLLILPHTAVPAAFQGDPAGPGPVTQAGKRSSSESPRS